MTDGLGGGVRLQVQAFARPWGAARAGVTPEGPVGELRLAGEDSTVVDGPWAGRTLAALIAGEGGAFLGEAAAALDGGRFPFLVKILVTGDWMSVQVHPDDQAARKFAAQSGWRGKHEAWIVLDAATDARLRIGVRPAVAAGDLMASAGSEAIVDLLAMRVPRAGELHEVPPGTIHAIGPGLTIWEAQTRSDLTWRLWDFGRERSLQVPQALAVARLAPAPAPTMLDDAPMRSGPFRIERIGGGRWQAPLHSCAVLTRIDGPLEAIEVRLAGAGQEIDLAEGAWLALTAADVSEIVELPK